MRKVLFEAKIRSLYQLIERGIIFETLVLKNMESNSDYTEIKGFRAQESENELKLELRKRVENVEILICIDCLIKKKILIMRNKKSSD